MRTKLVQLREGMGYNQIQFSALVGISRSHYAQIETGDKNPSLSVAMKIKKVAGYTGDDLFFNHERPETERL